MLYRPSPSLMTLRTFSISAGLDASMVTPGSTAPDESFTSPAIPLACCAQAVDASSTIATAATSRPKQRLRTIASSLRATQLGTPSVRHEHLLRPVLACRMVTSPVTEYCRGARD